MPHESDIHSLTHFITLILKKLMAAQQNNAATADHPMFFTVHKSLLYNLNEV